MYVIVKELKQKYEKSNNDRLIINTFLYFLQIEQSQRCAIVFT